MSIYTVYEYNNGAIVVAKIPVMTPTSKRISVKYNWFRHFIGRKFVIRKINSENQKADISTKGLQSELFVSNRKLL